MNKQTEALKMAIEQRLTIEQPNHVLDTQTGREMSFEFAEAYAHGLLKKIGKEALEQPAQEVGDAEIKQMLNDIEYYKNRLAKHEDVL